MSPALLPHPSMESTVTEAGDLEISKSRRDSVDAMVVRTAHSAQSDMEKACRRNCWLTWSIDLINGLLFCTAIGNLWLSSKYLVSISLDKFETSEIFFIILYSSIIVVIYTILGCHAIRSPSKAPLFYVLAGVGLFGAFVYYSIQMGLTYNTLHSIQSYHDDFGLSGDLDQDSRNLLNAFGKQYNQLYFVRQCKGGECSTPLCETPIHYAPLTCDDPIITRELLNWTQGFPMDDKYIQMCMRTVAGQWKIDLNDTVAWDRVDGAAATWCRSIHHITHDALTTCYVMIFFLVPESIIILISVVLVGVFARRLKAARAAAHPTPVAGPRAATPVLRTIQNPFRTRNSSISYHSQLPV